MVEENKILGWPAILADLEASAVNLWHGLAWTGNMKAACALVGQKWSGRIVYDPENAPSVDVGQFEIARIAKVLFDGSLARVNDTLRRDSLEWEFESMQLMTWLEMQPETSLVEMARTNGALRRLLSAASARNTLRDLADDMARPMEDGDFGNAPGGGFRLSIAGIAALAHMDGRSVRNDVGPSGRHPLRSLPRRKNKKRFSLDDYSIEIDAFEALGWLAGRRYFVAGKVDAHDYVPAILNATAPNVGRILGLLVWSNIGPTETARRRMGWSAGELDGWFKHGPTDEIGKQANLSELLGLDPTVLAAAHTRRS